MSETRNVGGQIGVGGLAPTDAANAVGRNRRNVDAAAPLRWNDMLSSVSSPGGVGGSVADLRAHEGHAGPVPDSCPHDRGVLDLCARPPDAVECLTHQFLVTEGNSRR